MASADVGTSTSRSTMRGKTLKPTSAAAPPYGDYVPMSARSNFAWRAWFKAIPLPWLIAAGAFCLAAGVGLYLMLFEDWTPITDAWHAAVSDATTRHDLRDVFMEGCGATFIAGLVVWDRWKPHGILRRFRRTQPLDVAIAKWEVRIFATKPTDRWLMKVWRRVLRFVRLPLYMIPGYLLGGLLMHQLGLDHGVHDLAGGAGQFLDRHLGLGVSSVIQSASSAWPQKIHGAVAFLMARRACWGFYDRVQTRFVSRRAARMQARGRRLRWYSRLLLPTGFTNKLNFLVETRKVGTYRQYNWFQRAVVWACLVGLVALAVRGEFKLYDLRHPPASTKPAAVQVHQR